MRLADAEETDYLSFRQSLSIATADGKGSLCKLKLVGL